MLVLSHGDRGDRRTGPALDLQRLHHKGELADILRGQLVELQILEQKRLVAWIGGAGALSPTRVPGYAMRTYSGRPSSSIRFSTSAAIATSIACRPSVWKRRPSPTTRFHREISHSTRARQLYP